MNLTALHEIIRFEVSSQLRSLATYLYLGVFFGLGFLVINLLTGVSGGFFIKLSGIDYSNSPVAIMTAITAFGGLGLLFAAGIFSQAACKDFETKFANILFSFPFQKWEYLAGRLSGATVVVLFILLGLGWGYVVGEFMPWLDREKLMPFNGLGYLNAYLYALIPNVVIFGGFCFGVGLLTRQTLLVYLVGVALFVSGNILPGILKKNPTLAGLIDPTGFSAFTNTTEFWTPAQKATQLVPLSSIILLNRLVWLGLSVSFLAFCFSKFSFSQLPSAASKKQKSLLTPQNLPSKSGEIPTQPRVHQSFDFMHQLGQLFSQTWIEFQSLVGNRWFLIALAVAIVPSMLVSGAQLGEEMYGTPNYPLTHLLIENAGKLYTQLFKLLIIFLAGEMIWRDRVARINPLTDTLPIRTFVLLLSKFAALALMVVSSLLMILVSGVLVQTFTGYTRYEFDVYFTILFTMLFPELLLLSAMSFFLQIAVQNRYLGYFLTALVLFGLPQLANLPQIPSIFVYGSLPETSYSQFDGFGATLAPVRWFQAYWIAWAVLLLTVAVLFWQRSVDESWRLRWRVASYRFTRTVQRVMLAAVTAIVGLGSWIYYNTRILNPILSDKAVEASMVAYEKNFKSLEATQPQITDIKLRYELYPEEQRLVAHGRYTLQNKTNLPLTKVLVSMSLDNGATVQRMSLSNLNGPTATKTVAASSEVLVAVRTFDLPTPLPPGQTTTLDFAIAWQPQGFKEKQQLTALITNGTNIDENLPYIGYFTSLELKDKKRREKYRLPKQFSDLTLQEQLRERDPSRTPELVTWSVIVGTSSDQIAVVPGEEQREWAEGDRRYFEYRMSEPVRNMMPLFSARYEVKRNRWQDVNLEIYYLKGHEFNVDRMMKAMQTSLEYYSKNFGPYPFKQARIFELPRGSFAFALPGTIGFAEYIGFLGRINDRNPQGVDYASYVTAHEMGHQWWGHQLVGDLNLSGHKTMDEILAQYSGLMVMSKLYGREKIRPILETELDWYFQGRAEAKQEEPLLTTDAQHVFYRKGVVAMYALKEHIGEANLNRALAKYLRERSKYSQNVPPYPTVMDLISYFRQATPPNQHFLITDLFESIVLYDAQAKSATATKRPNGKYEVLLTVSIQKFQSDEKGNEKSIDLNPNETVDIGVLGKDGKFLYLKKHQLKAGDNTISVVVDGEPQQAGIDPMYKLLNRSFKGNAVIVGKKRFASSVKTDY